MPNGEDESTGVLLIVSFISLGALWWFWMRSYCVTVPLATVHVVRIKVIIQLRIGIVRKVT